MREEEREEMREEVREEVREEEREEVREKGFGANLLMSRYELSWQRR